MKKIVLTAILALSAAWAVAQDDGNRDAYGKIVRGPYETNRFFDNIFIGVAGGVNVYEGENDSYGSFGKRLAPALDVSVGKWITPSVGLRMQYSGLKAKGWTAGKTAYAVGTPDSKGIYDEKFNVSNLHGDVLWNFSNAVSGYKETRTWNFVPYVGFGWARSWGNNHFSNQFAFNVGLLNNIRLGGLVDLTLEFRHMIVPQRFDGVVRGSKGEGMSSLTAGLTFKLNRRGFKRAEQPVIVDVSIYDDQIQALQDELAASNAKAKQLADALAAERNRKPETIVKTEVVSAPIAIFFTIGEANLTEKEKINLGYMAEVIKKSPDAKFKLVGSADKQTGSAKRNQQLSQMRAQAVYDALVKDFGVNGNQLEIVANGDRVEPFGQPYLNRVVLVK